MSSPKMTYVSHASTEEPWRQDLRRRTLKAEGQLLELKDLVEEHGIDVDLAELTQKLMDVSLKVQANTKDVNVVRDSLRQGAEAIEAEVRKLQNILTQAGVSHENISA